MTGSLARNMRSDWPLMASVVIGMLALTVVPLPAPLLDFFLGLSLCMAVLSFLVAFYVERPLDFSAFPTLLLFVTLFRLSLNVASTRLILLHGDDGKEAAGGVIRAFGEFAVGGNFVVGAVVFLILVIVNFIVITKGAERISEVAARFTLDSMPGKQMAIDADLGAGLISEAEARKRRREIAAESDFHGSMDGASKFVRGDAIAGLMITGINIVGGMVIGVAQNGMGAGDAATTYTVLSIGDGLVSQIPALLVSTGAALLITRKADGGVGDALGGQLLTRRRPLAISAGVLAVVGLLPGMPHISFLLLATGAGLLARRAQRISQAAPGGRSAKGEELGGGDEPKSEAQTQREEIESLLPVDLLAIDVGLDLLGMVDADRGGELLGRIASLRKQLATELGVIVPPVHVRDDLRLRPGSYKVIISGVEVAEGEVKASRLLAIDPSGRGVGGLPGELVTEPTFGMPAKWVVQADRTRAEAVGCTVVDSSAVIATHLTELIRRHAGELLGRAEAQELIDVASREHSKVVEELIPHLMSLGDVIKVQRNLLNEGVSLRDMRTILETLADEAGQIKDPAELTELVRQRLSRRITRAHMTEHGELKAMVLDPQAEAIFKGTGASLPRSLSELTGAIEQHTRGAIERDEPPVLVVAPEIRRTVSAVATRHIPGLVVLSYREIDSTIPFVTTSVIRLQEMAA